MPTAGGSPDDFDPNRLLELSQQTAELNRRMSETQARFKAFLQEHGADLGDTPEEEVARAVLIQSLSASYQMLQVAVEHGIDTRAVIEMRKLLERQLWDHGLLVEPWITLLDLEFGSEGLSEAELDDFARDLPSRYANEKRVLASIEQAIVDYLVFLFEHGREPTEADVELAVLLVSWKGIASAARKPSDNLHEEALIAMRQRGCECEQWHLLIDHEFLGMFE